MTNTPHPYRGWVDENDVGNTCCLAPRLDPIHTQPRRIKVDIRGMPHPQGSMRTHALPNGKVAVRYPPAVWDWRHKVQQAVAEAMTGATITVAVQVKLGFDLPRPADHYLPINSRRTEPELKPTAPPHPIGKPDTDKLTRAVLDAVTDAGLWTDDSQAVIVLSAKRYASPPGVHITIEELL